MPRAEGKTEVPETPPSPEKEKPVEKPPAAPPVPTEGSKYRDPSEQRESVSRTGFYITIVLAVPTFIFVTISICLAFKKAREADPKISFKEWLTDSVNDYAAFTFMQTGEQTPKPPRPSRQGSEVTAPKTRAPGDLIVNSDGTATRVQDKKQMQGMSLSKKSAGPVPKKSSGSRLLAPTAAPQTQGRTDDWDDWGDEENGE